MVRPNSQTARMARSARVRVEMTTRHAAQMALARFRPMAISVPLDVIESIQASASRIAPTNSTSPSVSIPTSVSTTISTALLLLTTTIIVTPTEGAQTPLQSATGESQIQSTPPRSLGLPLGLGLALGLSMLLFLGIGILIQRKRKRARPRMSVDQQEQETENELLEERAHDLGQVQMGEMDGAISKVVGRSELSAGMSAEARGMLELEGRLA